MGESHGAWEQTLIKPEEALAEKYLKHRGHTKIDYEPDGKVTPDFLVDDRIAVEVRRLNQNFVVGGKRRGLEEDATPLWQGIRKLEASFGPPIAGESWFIWYRYRRPIEDWKTLKLKLRRVLETFKLDPYATDQVEVTDRFSLSFRQAEKPLRTFFVLGGASDFDAGGFVVGELVTNIQLCIAEKTSKAAPVRVKYPEWELVLVNMIDNDLNEDERDEIRKHVIVPPIWRKVTVVNWRDHTHSFEL